MSYSRPMTEQLRDAEQALERMRSNIAFKPQDADLIVVLDGLMKVVKELAQYRWASGDEVAAQHS